MSMGVVTGRVGQVDLPTIPLRLSVVERVPWDVILAILRLLPAQDAMSVFMTCKHFFAMSTYRAFWVYANIDVDYFFRCSGRFDYTAFRIEELQKRLVKSLRVFAAWRGESIRPRRVQTLPVGSRILNAFMIPRTGILVTVEGRAVRIQMVGSRDIHRVPVVRDDDDILVFQVKTFWVNVVGHNILVVALSSGNRLDSAFRSQLQLFVVHEEVFTSERPSLLGWTYPSTVVLRSQPAHFIFRSLFRLVGSHDVSRSKVARVDQFIRGFECDAFHPGEPDGRGRLPILLPDVRWWISIICGNLLLCVSMTDDRRPHFSLSKVELIQRIPRGWEVAGDLWVGARFKPLASTRFTMFPLFTKAMEIHPFTLCEVVCRFDGVVMPGSLSMDEAEGRLWQNLRRDREGQGWPHKNKSEWALSRNLKSRKARRHRDDGPLSLAPSIAPLSRAIGEEELRVANKVGDTVSETKTFRIGKAYCFRESKISQISSSSEIYGPRTLVLKIRRPIWLRQRMGEDALAAMMTCKHFLSVASYRPFWVYVNIDLDFLQQRPRRGHIDYSGMTIPQLQARIVRCRDIYNAWRSVSRPRRVRTMSLNPGVRELQVIPWTRIVVILDDEGVELRDWGLRTSCRVPLVLGHSMLVTRVRNFWVESIGQNVIAVAASNKDLGAQVRTELHLIALDCGRLSTVHLVTVKFPHNISAFSLADKHLAVIGYSSLLRYCFIESLDVAYNQQPLVSTQATVCVGAQYKTYEALSRPPLGAVFVDPTSGQRTISICGGNYLRRLSMSTENPPQFHLFELSLIERMPMFLGIAVGQRIGLYHQRHHLPTLTTFNLVDNALDAHPLVSKHPSRQFRPWIDKSSVTFVLGEYEKIEHGSLNVDEGEGRVIFVVGNENFILTTSDMLARSPLQRTPHDVLWLILRLLPVTDAFALLFRVVVLPVNGAAHQLVVIPGTRIAITTENRSVLFWDWTTKTSRTIPVQIPDDNFTVVLGVKVFWVESLGQNVIVVALSRTLPPHSELQFFAMDTADLAAKYLTTVAFPHWISGFILADDHLATTGQSFQWSGIIHTFKITYSAQRTSWPIGICSLGVVDDTHFLLADPYGIAVFNFSSRAFEENGSMPLQVDPCWTYHYEQVEAVYRPLLGPVFIDASGRRSLSVCSGDFIRHVTMARDYSFSISTTPLTHRVPLAWSIARGVHVGVHHLRGSNVFTTFSLRDYAVADLHPFTARAIQEHEGKVVYRARGTIHPGSLNVDEGEGRIIFLSRRSARRVSMIILELAPSTVVRMGTGDCACVLRPLRYFAYACAASTSIAFNAEENKVVKEPKCQDHHDTHKPGEMSTMSMALNDEDTFDVLPGIFGHSDKGERARFVVQFRPGVSVIAVMMEGDVSRCCGRKKRYPSPMKTPAEAHDENSAETRRRASTRKEEVAMESHGAEKRNSMVQKKMTSEANENPHRGPAAPAGRTIQQIIDEGPSSLCERPKGSHGAEKRARGRRVQQRIDEGLPSLYEERRGSHGAEKKSSSCTGTESTAENRGGTVESLRGKQKQHVLRTDEGDRQASARKEKAVATDKDTMPPNHYTAEHRRHRRASARKKRPAAKRARPDDHQDEEESRESTQLRPPRGKRNGFDRRREGAKGSVGLGGNSPSLGTGVSGSNVTLTLLITVAVGRMAPPRKRQRLSTTSNSPSSIRRPSPFELIPFDVLLLILRLLPLPVALATLLTCKRLFAVSEYRPFWVYVNIDADAFGLCPGPGNGANSDYTKVSIAALKNRVLTKYKVFLAWQTKSVRPKRIRTLPVDGRTHQLVSIPWTKLVVVADDDTVSLLNWATKSTSTIPVTWAADLLIFAIKIFWIESIGRNVIVVALSNRYESSVGCSRPLVRTELQLFIVDVAGSSAAFLAKATFSHWVSTFDLSGNNLAVVGHSSQRSYFIRCLDVRYDVHVDPPTVLVVRLGRRWPVASCSFAILDPTHYLLAGPLGVVVYKFSLGRTRDDSVCPPCWYSKYEFFEVVFRPPLGPILVDPVSGDRTMSFCSGEFIRQFSMTTGEDFCLSETSLVDRVPLNWGLTRGLRTGIHHKPFVPHTFTAFPFFSSKGDLHPFGSPASRRNCGTVLYNVNGIIEPHSLNMDESEGRIVFMRRVSSTRATVVILELV
ncbi:hypothetical protein C8R46DRAFT_1024909 [Mycena filopes]|nr:hypothetical protein C8R46DRAFT_1024909 [Mycena filopes]